MTYIQLYAKFLIDLGLQSKLFMKKHVLKIDLCKFEMSKMFG